MRSSGSNLISGLQKTMASLTANSQLLLESWNGDAMKSKRRGANISRAEVTKMSPEGFWLLLGKRQLFVSYAEFPWFQEAPIRKIHHVEWPSEDHLYWPDLDIDLSVRSIEHPEEFPLKFGAV